MSATSNPLLAALSKAPKLKKVESKEKRDTSAPKLGKNNESDISEKDVVKYHDTVQEANIEEWETALKDETFRTVYLPMSVEEAKAFLEVTEAFSKKIKASDDAIKILDKVEVKLQKLIDEQKDWNPEGVFCKTSSRSAKDAAIAQKQLVDVYKQYLKSIASPPYQLNEKIISLFHAGTQMLKCKNAKHCMEMFKGSERIEQDMRLALIQYERKKEWNENIVVREWVTIDVSQEWRCFVYKRKVTGISQYNYIPCFDDLVKNSDYLQKIIEDYLVNVAIKKLPDKFQNMVIDVAITGDIYNNPKLYVIELNPFLSSTDGALFSWSIDGDILHGKKPMEFRLTKKRSEGVKTSLLHEWRKLLDLKIE